MRDLFDDPAASPGPGASAAPGLPTVRHAGEPAPHPDRPSNASERVPRAAEALNPAQSEAAHWGLVAPGAPGTGGLDPAAGPLLIVAGAGTGKTTTLAHRVAAAVRTGVDPRRILLLTFTRRAAGELESRVQAVLRAAGTEAAAGLRWAGTFHAVANRLLRLHAEEIELDPAFTVLDRGDAADLLNWLRGGLGLASSKRRFPSKHSCLAIYSHATNAQCALEETLDRSFPWCRDWFDELDALFAAYVEAKQQRAVLDYDDLLLYWHALMEEPALADAVRERFDMVLVDEYQDTNRLQAEILMRLTPSGFGLTAVGDDAQSIYSFRAATVRNILDFPKHFERPARVVLLEENHRSTPQVLDACNAVMDKAHERHAKRLFSRKAAGLPPVLVCAQDEDAQVAYVVRSVLEQREAGMPLHRQAVLFRAAHHSDSLEVELGRRQIPFVKYGGLKFLEAAHVKDLLCVLRWAQNPRDSVAGFRVLQLLHGVGPAIATRALDGLAAASGDFRSLEACVPAALRDEWLALARLMQGLVHEEAGSVWAAQVGRVREWYEPVLERLYDAPIARLGDLDQLEQIASTCATRERFLSDLALDPPDTSSDLAADPRLDDDQLVLSTIHSAKGREWDAVFLLQAADGAIPSDLATRRPEEIEEERRLLYVAMSRARAALHVIHPMRMFVRSQARFGDASVLAPRSRFLDDDVVRCFERRAEGARRPANDGARSTSEVRVDVGARVRARWGRAGTSRKPTGPAPGR